LDYTWSNYRCSTFVKCPRYVRIPQDIIFKSYAEEFILTSTVDNVKENHKIIKDDLDIFKWDLIEEESDTLILNFKCKKAKTKFRGREYIAYYSNEIANFGGPWKFDGLPGFILKIYSLDGFLSIEPISIRVDNNNQTVKIINPFENKRFIYFNDLKNVILKEEQEHFKRAKSSNPYLTSIKKGGSFNTIEDIGLNYERKYE
jgi:GLPGLI family protein